MTFHDESQDQSPAIVLNAMPDALDVKKRFWNIESEKMFSLTENANWRC